MAKRTLSIALLVTVVAIISLFVFYDSTASKPEDSSDSSSPPSNEVGDSTGGVIEETAPDHEQQTDDGGSASPDQQERYAEVSDNPDYPQLQSRLEAMRKRRPGKSFDPEQVVKTMARTEAWTRVDTPPADLPLTPAEKYDGREFIRFNPLRIETLMPGDTLEIPIWQLGARFKMRVDYAETHANGSVTWHGHLENVNEPHRVTITVGDGLSLGGIDTPNGHYVLQANGESGWIASSETLFKRNETETDMVVPPAGEPEGGP